VNVCAPACERSLLCQLDPKARGGTRPALCVDKEAFACQPRGALCMLRACRGWPCLAAPAHPGVQTRTRCALVHLPAGGHRARRGPAGAGGVAARAVQEDEGALRHRQGAALLTSRLPRPAPAVCGCCSHSCPCLGVMPAPAHPKLLRPVPLCNSCKSSRTGPSDRVARSLVRMPS